MDVEVTETPTAFMEGRFSLFNTPDGGIHLCYRADGADDDEHIQLPPILVKIAEGGVTSGKMPNPMEIFKLMKTMKG